VTVKDLPRKVLHLPLKPHDLYIIFFGSDDYSFKDDLAYLCSGEYNHVTPIVLSQTYTINFRRASC
jgi:hypothetical protein